MSFPYRFTETNAILTTEDGQSYSVALYCQRQLSDCPKLLDSEVYWGKMGKKAMLKSPSKVDLRPDGPCAPTVGTKCRTRFFHHEKLALIAQHLSPARLKLRPPLQVKTPH
jgi:hypothetical protein